MSTDQIQQPEAQVIVDTATAAAGPTELDTNGRFFAVAVPSGGRVDIIDLEDHLDDHRETPRRKKGTYSVQDVPSFARYFEKHSDPATEVWADTGSASLVAVLNAHTYTDTAGWEDHKLQYVVKKTDAWKAWTENDGKLLSQMDFAEHIEARAIDIVEPSGADMLELVQTFQATIGVQFKSSRILSTGERQLTYEETVDGKAGHAGQMDIPKEIQVGLIPFEGAAPVLLVARFRYRITNGELKLGYVLERPADALRDAFVSVVEKVEEAIGAVVMYGSGLSR